MHLLPGFYHDTLGERDRAPALDKIRAFIQRVEAGAPAVDLSRADAAGYTALEYQQLQQPRSWLSPLRWQFALTRLTLATLGRLSAGIRLGWRTGFDSGSTLDYVYRNQVSGISPLGRLGDRAYLDSVGWKGIRQRKLNLEELIAMAMGRLRADGQPLRLLDIAAGHGRYILDAIAGQPVEHVQLRDYSDINVGAGRRLIAERGLDAVARFDQGNAFDRASLAALQPAPTLAVVSGLYELFPENEPIRQSLAGLAEAVPGGYLVYTNQPWHPQLELIARTLSSHRGGADWIMRRRTQQEMDQLVADAGFEAGAAHRRVGHFQRQPGASPQRCRGGTAAAAGRGRGVSAPAEPLRVDTQLSGVILAACLELPQPLFDEGMRVARRHAGDAPLELHHVLSGFGWVLLNVDEEERYLAEGLCFASRPPILVRRKGRQRPAMPGCLAMQATPTCNAVCTVTARRWRQSIRPPLSTSLTCWKSSAMRSRNAPLIICAKPRGCCCRPPHPPKPMWRPGAATAWAGSIWIAASSARRIRPSPGC